MGDETVQAMECIYVGVSQRHGGKSFRNRKRKARRMQKRAELESCDNFDICPTFYKSVVCSAGLENLFRPRKQSPTGLKQNL